VEHAARFRDKLDRGEVCLGTAITFADPTVTEALCTVLDFVWIDMEHNPLSLETVQGHIMATKGSATTPLVRVPWNDPVLIKPVLDIGAAGVIVPMIRTADDARRAVAACRYPPEGIRGFGPRRASAYGQRGGPAFCQEANETILVTVQIEHIDAVHNLAEILAVPGLTSIVVGPNDLSGSMGHPNQPDHPDVRRTIKAVIAQARQTSVSVGMGGGDDPDRLVEWLDEGVQWIAMGADFALLLQAARSLASQVRAGVRHPHS
jgi:2-dehydro-3-deoxyglucarate aldolase/4-hydroxy-2-oxoheptanedioate aldolase